MKMNQKEIQKLKKNNLIFDLCMLWACIIIIILLGMCSCISPPKKPSVYDVDITILTEREAFNHYRGDRPDVYHRKAF